MQCSSKEEGFWKMLLGQLLITPHSWQRGVFKLISLHVNLGAGLVSINNSELSSKARNHFAGCCTVKTQTMISTPVTSECFCGRRAEAEEEWGRLWVGQMPRAGSVQDVHISSNGVIFHTGRAFYLLGLGQCPNGCVRGSASSWWKNPI